MQAHQPVVRIPVEVLGRCVFGNECDGGSDTPGLEACGGRTAPTIRPNVRGKSAFICICSTTVPLSSVAMSLIVAVTSICESARTNGMTKKIKMVMLFLNAFAVCLNGMGRMG